MTEAEKIVPKPCSCLALLLAEHVRRDRQSGRCDILGTIGAVFAERFPALSEPLHLYAALTDMAPGPHAVRVELAYLDEAHTIVREAEGELHADCPLAVCELHFMLGPIELPRAGALEATLYLDGTLVQTRRFAAALLPRRA